VWAPRVVSVWLSTVRVACFGHAWRGNPLKEEWAQCALQGTWKWDHYSYGQLQDIIVFTMQGLMAVFAASQSPLQSAFRTVGSNMLGVFVCQFVLVSVIWNLPNSGGFFATVQAIQTDEYFGDGVLGGIVQVSTKSHCVALRTTSLSHQHKLTCPSDKLAEGPR
jgi:hypothetical protein